MYQALYRKWRPQRFDDVVGQRHITQTLKNQVASSRVSHAYLFTGTRGTGKTTVQSFWPGLLTASIRWTEIRAMNVQAAAAF